MSSKVVLVIIDGLNYQVALNCLGYLNALVETGRSLRKKLVCELPGLSRPLYETILTGTHPIDSGIIDNNVVRLSNQSRHLFPCSRTRIDYGSGGLSLD